MTRFLRFALFAAIALSATSLTRAAFIIEGNLPQLRPGAKLSLKRADLKLSPIRLEHAIELQEDRTFRAEIDAEPGLFVLEFPGDQKLPLAIDSGQTVSISRDPDTPTGYALSGSPDSEALLAYEAFRRESLERLVYPPRAAAQRAKSMGRGRAAVAELTQREIDGYAEHRRELSDFTIEQVGDSVALYATALRWDGDYRLDELKRLVERFAAERPGLAIATDMRERIQIFERVALGATAPSLAGQGIDGATNRLDDLRGNYVLVDFWASWCPPCRVENPHYRKLRDQYSDRGFEVFGISLDDDRSRWEAATRRDRIDWPQVFDGLGFESPHALAYGVTALPASFLLDREGRIIAKNLRGAELEERLAALFP